MTIQGDINLLCDWVTLHVEEWEPYELKYHLSLAIHCFLLFHPLQDMEALKRLLPEFGTLKRTRPYLTCHLQRINPPLHGPAYTARLHVFPDPFHMDPGKLHHVAMYYLNRDPARYLPMQTREHHKSRLTTEFFQEKLDSIPPYDRFSYQTLDQHLHHFELSALYASCLQAQNDSVGFGDIRSHLHSTQKPSKQAFSALCRLLERVPLDQLHRILPYTLDHISSWSPSVRTISRKFPEPTDFLIALRWHNPPLYSTFKWPKIVEPLAGFTPTLEHISLTQPKPTYGPQYLGAQRDARYVINVLRQLHNNQDNLLQAFPALQSFRVLNHHHPFPLPPETLQQLLDEWERRART